MGDSRLAGLMLLTCEKDLTDTLLNIETVTRRCMEHVEKETSCLNLNISFD